MGKTDLPPRNIALRISYDGTNFCGWQRQNGGSAGLYRTVQEVLERALERIHKHPVQLIGSGRTDSGVHAVGQLANFLTDIPSIPESRFVYALNSILPQDVRILSSWSVPLDFHSRFSARSRTYRYFIHCGKTALAHELPYVWHIGRWPNVAILSRMSTHLYGKIDCTTFAATADMSHTKMRHLHGARFFPDGDKLVFEITANAFLQRMVRSLTGTLLSMEKNGKNADDFAAVLHSRDRLQAGPTAPGTGLFLWNIQC